MFKLLQTIFSSESELNGQLSREATPSELEQHKLLKSKLSQAEDLWQQGNITEAISLCCQAIELQPNSDELYGKLSAVLKQQGELATAYKQLAVQLKQKGEAQEAATCYRQAIVLQTFNYGAGEKYLQQMTALTSKPRLQAANLADSAFSFQPLSASSSQPTKKRILQISLNDDYGENELFSQVNTKTASIIDETAKLYMQQALEHCDQQQWEQAAIACENATKIAPDMAEAYKVWGNALQRMGQTAEAMDCYARAVEIQPDLAEVYARIGSLYAQQKQWQQAIEYYQKAIIIRPSFAQAYRNLAEIWHLIGEPEKADFCRKQASNLESAKLNSSQSTSDEQEFLPSNQLKQEITAKELISTIKANSVEEYQKLAQSLEKHNKWQEAAIYYRKALEMNLAQLSSSVSETKPQNQLTQVEQLKQLLPDNSSEETKLATTVDSVVPDSSSVPDQSASLQRDLSSSSYADTEPNKIAASAQQLLRSIPSKQNQLDKAIRRYLKQAKLKPDSAKIHTDLGNLYAKRRQWKAAITAYHKAIQINESYALAYLNLGKILAKIGKNRESVGYMYRALTLNPELFSAKDYFYLGKSFIEQGKLRQGMSYCFKATKLEPNYLEAYHHIGALMSKHGQQQKAINYFRKAIERNPREPQSYYLLGQELAAQKKWDEAVKAYSQVLKIQPRFAQASEKLNHALAEKLKQELKTKQD